MNEKECNSEIELNLYSVSRHASDQRTRKGRSLRGNSNWSAAVIGGRNEFRSRLRCSFRFYNTHTHGEKQPWTVTRVGGNFRSVQRLKSTQEYYTKSKKNKADGTVCIHLFSSRQGTFRGWHEVNRHLQFVPSLTVDRLRSEYHVLGGGIVLSVLIEKFQRRISFFVVLKERERSVLLFNRRKRNHYHVDVDFVEQSKWLIDRTPKSQKKAKGRDRSFTAGERRSTALILSDLFHEQRMPSRRDLAFLDLR